MTRSQERQTKQKQSQTKDQIENIDLFKETNKVNICSRERNVRAVKRQLRCNCNKNKKEHKNNIFVEKNKDKIKLRRDKINIKKNRKRENNTRGKIQQRKKREREKEQWSIGGAEQQDDIKLNRRQLNRVYNIIGMDWGPCVTK